MLKGILLLAALLIWMSQLFAEDKEEDEMFRILRIQTLLDQAGFSPGEIDGESGSNTEKALFVFQRARGLPKTGAADDRTMAALLTAGKPPTMKKYRITAADVRGPFAREIPEDYMEKAKLPRMSYTSPLEAITEKFHIEPDLFLYLNPEVSFRPGEIVIVPNVVTLPAQSKGPPKPVQPVKGTVSTPKSPLKVVISAANSDLMVTRGGKIIYYAPISHGGERDPVPVGKTTIAAITAYPVYRYNPKLFWDADPSHTKALIRPGPNNPVGVVWIALNLAHYGLHGTPQPGAIGYGQSHGCIRMTNWDATRLASLVDPGTEVLFAR